MMDTSTQQQHQHHEQQEQHRITNQQQQNKFDSRLLLNQNEYDDNNNTTATIIITPYDDITNTIISTSTPTTTSFSTMTATTTTTTIRRRRLSSKTTTGNPTTNTIQQQQQTAPPPTSSPTIIPVAYNNSIAQPQEQQQQQRQINTLIANRTISDGKIKMKEGGGNNVDDRLIDDDYLPIRRNNKSNSTRNRPVMIGGYHYYHPITDDNLSSNSMTELPGVTIVPRHLRHRERHIVNSTGIYYDIVDDDDYYTYDNKTYATSVSIRVTPLKNFYVSWMLLWIGFFITSIFALYQICYKDPLYNRYKNRHHYSKLTRSTKNSNQKNHNTKISTYRAMSNKHRRQQQHEDGIDDNNDSPSSTSATPSPSTPNTIKSNLKHPILTVKNVSTKQQQQLLQPRLTQQQQQQQHHRNNSSESMAGVLLHGSTSIGTDMSNSDNYYQHNRNNSNNSNNIESIPKSSADDTRTMFRKLLLIAIISRMIVMPIQIWTDPQWYQFVSDTLPEMIFASAWTLLVSFFIQLVSVATDGTTTSTNTSPGIIIQATSYVVYLFLIGTQLFNTVATILLYALLCCIYAALLGVVLFYCPRLIALLKPILFPQKQQPSQQQSEELRQQQRQQQHQKHLPISMSNEIRNSSSSNSSASNSSGSPSSSKTRSTKGPALAIRLVIVTLLCIAVFLAHTISYARLVVMPPRRVYWWWSYGCLELIPSIIFLILMHPHTEKIDPDDDIIIDPDLTTPLMAPSTTTGTDNKVGSGGNDRHRLFGLLRRADSSSGTIRRNDSNNSNTLQNFPTTNGGSDGVNATGLVSNSTRSSGGMVVGNSSNSNTPSNSSSNIKQQHQQIHETTALLKHTGDGSSSNAAIKTSTAAAVAFGGSGYGSVSGTLSPVANITTPIQAGTGDPTVSPL